MADGKVKIDIEADGSDAKKELKNVEEAAQSAGEGAEKAGDGARKAGEGFEAAAVAAGTFVADGLQAIISGAVDTVRALLDLSESTREYREDMAKLDVAFTSQGHSADIAAAAYETMVGYLGESDRAVEAANHLAGIVKGEEDVAKWSNIAAGTLAVFQDSLPTEALTESAAQTAELGELTGPLVDALSRAGISEEEFNKQLAACADEQERGALITETLNEKYATAAEQYKELTGSTYDANVANDKLAQSQADIGATIEPVTTAWTNLKTQGLEAILPAIQWVADAIQDVTQWMNEHETAATIIKGVIIGLAVALGVLAVALGIAGLIQIVTTAMASLGAVIAFVTSPITLTIAAIAGLVAAFIYLWNNCDAFRNFWINLWEQIKNIASQVWAAIVAVFESAWSGIKAIWDVVSPYFSAVWETIKGIFAVVKSVLSGNFSDAWLAIKGIVGVWASYFSGVWSNIKGIFAVVGEWFRGIFQGAYTAITNIWDSISGYFSDLYADITGAFDSILDDFFNVGDNIISGIWNGLSAGWDWLVGKVKNLAASLFGAAQEELDSHSPSRKFAWLGETAPQGLAVGFKRGMPEAISTAQEELDALTARVYATVGAESTRVGRSMGRPETGFSDLARAVGMQTAGISSLSAEYRRGSANMRPVILELDGRELGRAVVDVGRQESTRVGAKIALGGAL